MYDVALIEKPGNDGLTADDFPTLFALVGNNAEVYPVEFDSRVVESSAMGIITKQAASMLDYDYSSLDSFVSAILDDMDTENPYGEYVGPSGLMIHLGR